MNIIETFYVSLPLVLQILAGWVVIRNGNLVWNLFYDMLFFIYSLLLSWLLSTLYRVKMINFNVMINLNKIHDKNQTRTSDRYLSHFDKQLNIAYEEHMHIHERHMMWLCICKYISLVRWVPSTLLLWPRGALTASVKLVNEWVGQWTHLYCVRTCSFLFFSTTWHCRNIRR